MVSKKRHHPDGQHPSSYVPKRPFTLSEAELGSSVNSADDTATCSGGSSKVQDVSMWNTAPYTIMNSESSMSFRDSEHSSTTAGVTSPKHGAAKSSRDFFHDGKGKGSCLYDPDPSKRSRIDSEAEVSEVTFENQKWHAHNVRTAVYGQEPDGEPGFVNSRHLSSRTTGFLNSRSKMDGILHNVSDGYGHCALPSRQMEARQGRDKPGDETESSCGESSEDSFIKEKRSRHGFSDSFSPACRESSTTSPSVHFKAEVLVETKAEERIESSEKNSIERYNSSEDSFDRGVMEAPHPSYVLSSGRLSLEEEARMGRRAPTIDHDFEEYFSSLML